MRRTVYVIATVLLMGCGGPGPQRPSQVKSGESAVSLEDEMGLMELNREMAARADKELHALVQKEDAAYALYEGGVWARIEEIGEGASLRMGEECTLHMRVMRLDGTLYRDEELSGVIGKYEFLSGVDRNLPDWLHGARVRMYVPWYSAYGLRGTEDIPPYENVKIELDIR